MDTQKLKDKILQLAIQGKLVDQDPNDEPASELLKKIEAEKKKLYKEGKIRKPKKLPPINDEEKPFDIPESWEWVRFNDINKIITCGHASTPEYFEKGMPFISAKNIKPYKFMPKDHKLISYELYDKLTKKNKPEINDILMTRVGAGIGESAIIDVNFNFAIYVSLTLIKPFHEYVSSRYILHWLNSPEGVNKSIENTYGKGSSQGNLNVGNVRSYILPVPPLNEQKRIVEKIDVLFKLIDNLDSDKEKLLETIELTRNKVLQDAIQGKLVEQDPKDEPASELLKKIEAEKKKLYKDGKIRKPKKLPPIKDEEKPFDISESWEWVRLGEVCNFINGDRGKNYPSKKDLVEEGIPFINAGHLKEGLINLEEMNYITKEKFDKLNNGKIIKDDIIYCLRGTLGKCSINENVNKGAIASSLVIIRKYLNTKIEYLYYYLMSPLGKYMIDKFDNGTAQPNLSANSVKNYLLPLPPLNEQNKIIEKIDKIFNHCDLLEELTRD